MVGDAPGSSRLEPKRSNPRFTRTQKNSLTCNSPISKVLIIGFRFRLTHLIAKGWNLKYFATKLLSFVSYNNLVLPFMRFSFALCKQPTTFSVFRLESPWVKSGRRILSKKSFGFTRISSSTRTDTSAVWHAEDAKLKNWRSFKSLTSLIFTYLIYLPYSPHPV